MTSIVKGGGVEFSIIITICNKQKNGTNAWV